VAMQPCKECGKEVSTQAKKCPNCGKYDPTGSHTRTKIILFGIICIFILISHFSGRKESKSTTMSPVADTVGAVSADAASTDNSDGVSTTEAEKITVATPGDRARLCDKPMAGMDGTLARIKTGTVLKVLDTYDAYQKMPGNVRWYKVAYKGKEGWVSFFDTDQAP